MFCPAAAGCNSLLTLWQLPGRCQDAGGRSRERRSSSGGTACAAYTRAWTRCASARYADIDYPICCPVEQPLLRRRKDVAGVISSSKILIHGCS